jgi:8-hydroxy-5-deazaflavin:NADPH oxidoreductase
VIVSNEEESSMNVGVLGTGVVGNAIASKLAALGHAVKMGSREAGNEKAVAWAEAAGDNASEGSFADAAAFGEVVFNCTNGEHSLAALEQAGRENLAGKVLVDVANVLDFSGGRPPIVGVGTTDSLGEQIQRAFPDVKVVKALNTMNCDVMVDPAKVPGEHDVFVCGEDADAKAEVAGLLRAFGWPAEHIVDLGGLRAARGTELYVTLWLSLWGVVGSGGFNIALVRGA